MAESIEKAQALYESGDLQAAAAAYDRAIELDQENPVAYSGRGQIYLDQPASALFGIRSLMGLIPGVALLLGALLLVWFPLRGSYLAEVQERVLALHAEKLARSAAPAETPTDA